MWRLGPFFRIGRRDDGESVFEKLMDLEDEEGGRGGGGRRCGGDENRFWRGLKERSTKAAEKGAQWSLPLLEWGRIVSTGSRRSSRL